MFSFVKDAGRKVGLFGGRKAATREDAEEAVDLAEGLKAAVKELGLPVEGLGIGVDGDTVRVRGAVASREIAEKIVLFVGNHEGVAQVEDLLEVTAPVVEDAPEQESTFHTVVKGDTLSAIAKTHYGKASLFPLIFDANRPMLGDPNEIFPGQLLRIPAREAVTYTVQKGDTLGGIAKKLLGSAGAYKQLFAANTDVLDDPNVIEVGQVLRIPQG